MKKAILILLIIGAIAGGGKVFIEDEKEEAVNPLYIEALKNRQFERTNIEIGETTRDNSGYTAKKVSYRSDGLKLNALLAIPKGTIPDAGFPVVVVNHGHIEPDKYSTENSYINTTGFFAGSGFVVLKPDFRGHGESEGEADTLKARMEYAVDVLSLLAGIESLPVKTDPDRVYMWGHSMGGDVTLRVIEASNKVKAASLWAPAVTDFPENVFFFARKNDEKWNQRLSEELTLGFSPQDIAKISTLENVNMVSIPVNVHASSNDNVVPREWADTLVEKMKAAGKTVNYYVYEGTSHDIAQAWSTALKRDLELFSQLPNRTN